MTVASEHTLSETMTGPATATHRERASEGAMLRVLHVNSGNLYGGVETVLTTLARLRQLCPTMEPHFALCHEGRLSEELAAAHVPVRILGQARISRPWSVWRARRRLAELLQAERFDLVICHMPWSLAVFGGTIRKSRTRLGFWAHGFHTGHTWLERLASRTPPDFGIANSCFTESGLANLFPDLPRSVIYYPVALQAPQDANEPRSELRKQFGAGDDTIVIVQVSRLEAWKGHLLHLRALAQLKVTSKWVCWMVGGAQQAEEEEYFELLKERSSSLASRIAFDS